MILSEAVNIRRGTTDVTAVYRGSTLVWPPTPSGLWTFASGLSGTITGFRAVFTGAVNALLGAASTALTSNASTNLNASSASLTLSSPSSVTSITCGTSSPKLGGTIDVSSFPNLTSITCSGNGITRFQGYGSLTNLVDINLSNNEFNQVGFETLTNKPNLRTLNFSASVSDQYINWTGAFPDLSQNTKLQNIAINNSRLTGSNLDFSMLTDLRTVSIQANRLSGAFPLLPTGADSKLTSIHFGTGSAFARYTGNPPLISDHPNLTSLVYSNNSVAGAIPSLPTRMTNFWCDANLHTGNIPSLTGLASLTAFVCRNQRGTTRLTGSIPNLSTNTALVTFWCGNNQLTAFSGGSVSATLGDFQAQGNQLTAAAVNAILAAFVAAGRTTGTRTLNLGGTGNAAPTGQGITDKATLESRGWTVTTN